MTAQRDKSGRFLPGHPGKKRGCKNKHVLVMEKLGGEKVDQLLDKLFSLAMLGDGTALKILADKIWPNVKSSPVKFKLPSIENVEDLPLLSAALLQAVSEGKIPPDSASQISALIQAHAKSVEVNCQQLEIDKLKEVIDVSNN